jgi:phosphoesterase RecJ-like protein
MTIDLSADKLAAAAALAAAIRPGQRVCLTTHVNPDGDGIGSMVAMVHLLRALGADPVIVSPTPIPPRYHFLLDGLKGVDRTPEAIKEIRRADLLFVVDIADLGRLGMLNEAVRDRGVPVACVDHHVSAGTLPPGPRYVDPQASATGELIAELAEANDWAITPPVAQALYVAILTDTGGFRFSNTRPRVLRVAADLLECGVDPERIYLQVYANAPEGRQRLLAEALQTLVVEHQVGLSWITIPPGSMERHNVSADDLDGVVEYARSVEGVRMALLFREIAQGRVKVSLRSVGEVDVADFAKQFGGGGHRKAAGLSLEGPLADVQAAVLGAARSYLLRSTSLSAVA